MKCGVYKRSYGPGEDIFGKYDSDKLVEDGPTDNSTDEDEDKEDEDEDDENDDEEDEDENEEDKEEKDFSEKTKKHTILPWDVLVNIAAENLHETMEETLAEHQNKDIQEAEEMAYEELKPNYLSHLISRYKYIVGMTAALKKDPVHQRIMRTAKRFREEEDYNDDESMQYAIKKRKFLIERKLKEYDPPSHEEDEEQSQTQSLPYKAPKNTLLYKPMNSSNVMKY